jgi:hypothetical protein
MYTSILTICYCPRSDNRVGLLHAERYVIHVYMYIRISFFSMCTGMFIPKQKQVYFRCIMLCVRRVSHSMVAVGEFLEIEQGSVPTGKVPSITIHVRRVFIIG